MNRHASLLLVALLSGAACAQSPRTQDGGTTVVTMRDGGVSQVLQSIYLPTIINAPFTAIVHAEWVRPMPEGGSFTFVNQRRIARDSTGRIYEERWALVPKGGGVNSVMTTIQLGDPNAHTLYNCYMLQKPHRCVLETFAETAEAVYKPAISTSGMLPNNMGFRTHEDLGSRWIDGIETHGTRDTTNYNAGVMGSDKPFASKREFWHAPQIGINLYSELVDPSVGKQIFTITDVTLTEPDPKLFELPQGFAVVDTREPVEKLPE
jgi:hypothetical protein